MKYRVYVETLATCSVEVEAESPEDAADKALQGSLPTLCAHCSGWGRPVGLELGEWDVADLDEDVELIGDPSVTEKE